MRSLLLAALVPAMAAAQTTTQVVEYYTTDAIGSVRAVTKRVNEQWQVTRHDFMPFGEEVSPQNPPQDKRLFTGKERDAETGQDYFEARYLRATAGRFSTVDPAMTVRDNLPDPQRWNRYAYVRANPLRYTDPTGMYIAGCAMVELACAKEIARFEGLRQKALKNKDAEVRAVAERLGEPGQKGPTVKPDFRGELGKANGSFDMEKNVLAFKPGIGGRVGLRTLVHEASHNLDRILATGKPNFDEWQITRWESDVRAFDLGARIQPYQTATGRLKAGDRGAIEAYMLSEPVYNNFAKYYPIVPREW
jgi:RHS repeat-associated protein